jgi:hypothetical protein
VEVWFGWLIVQSFAVNGETLFSEHTIPLHFVSGSTKIKLNLSN